MKRKPTSADRVSNCGTGWWARGASFVVPAVLSMIALTGVSTGPALELGDHELAFEAAQRRAAGWEHVSRDRLACAKTVETATAALEHLRALIPGDCSPVIAHGLVRTAAAACGLSVDSLQIGEDRDLALVGPHDRLVARELSLAGKSDVATVLALLSTLRGLGFPTGVSSASFVRADPSQRFDYRIELGLLHYAPLEAASDIENVPVDQGGLP